MSRQITLRPVDVPVALRLVETPEATYGQLGEDLGISSSSAHSAVNRLSLAGLMHPHQRTVNRLALLEFLEHGVQYAFPPIVGGAVRGVPTSHAAPILASEIIADDAIVWPDPQGQVVGESLLPLYDGAVNLPRHCASLYEMLALVDALRVGRARERKIASRKLREKFGRPREHADA